MNEWVLYLIVYPILSVILLFIVNWLGKHSYSLGYHKIDFIVDREDNFAFNFSLKVLTPTVFILILSTIFYYFKLDFLTKNIYLIVVYSVFLRTIINLWLGRLHILDWKLQIFYAIVICLVGYAAYYYLILPKKPLIPDFNTISNELWILVGLFVYKVVNQIEISTEKKKKRIKHYISVKYKNFEKLYDAIIVSFWREKINELFKPLFSSLNEMKCKNLIDLNNQIFIKLTYSVMIFEDFNRPRNVRTIENFVAKHSSKDKTLGVMQVKSSKLITDKESVLLGMELIALILNNHLKYIMEDDYCDWYGFLENILQKYNLDEDYADSVISILEQLPDGKVMYDTWRKEMSNL